MTYRALYSVFCVRDSVRETHSWAKPEPYRWLPLISTSMHISHQQNQNTERSQRQSPPLLFFWQQIDLGISSHSGYSGSIVSYNKVQTRIILRWERPGQVRPIPAYPSNGRLDGTLCGGRFLVSLPDSLITSHLDDTTGKLLSWLLGFFTWKMRTLAVWTSWATVGIKWSDTCKTLRAVSNTVKDLLNVIHCCNCSFQTQCSWKNTGCEEMCRCSTLNSSEQWTKEMRSQIQNEKLTKRDRKSPL